MEFRYNKGGRAASAARVADLLGQVLNAGYIDPPAAWNVPLRKGHHEGLITFAAFQQIQQNLQDIPRGAGAKRSVVGLSIPRGAVVCASCDQALTAGWSTGLARRRIPITSARHQGGLIAANRHPPRADRKRVRGNVASSAAGGRKKTLHKKDFWTRRSAAAEATLRDRGQVLVKLDNRLSSSSIASPAPAWAQ